VPALPRSNAMQSYGGGLLPLGAHTCPFILQNANAASAQACLSVDPEQRPTAKRCFQIIRAAIAGEDVASEPHVMSPAHLSTSGSMTTLSEPIVGGSSYASGCVPG